MHNVIEKCHEKDKQDQRLGVGQASAKWERTLRKVF